MSVILLVTRCVTLPKYLTGAAQEGKGLSMYGMPRSQSQALALTGPSVRQAWPVGVGGAWGGQHHSPPVGLWATRVPDATLGALAEGLGQGSWLGGGPGGGLRPHSGQRGEVGSCTRALGGSMTSSLDLCRCHLLPEPSVVAGLWRAPSPMATGALR